MKYPWHPWAIYLERCQTKMVPSVYWGRTLRISVKKHFDGLSGLRILSMLPTARSSLLQIKKRRFSTDHWTIDGFCWTKSKYFLGVRRSMVSQQPWLGEVHQSPQVLDWQVFCALTHLEIKGPSKWPRFLFCMYRHNMLAQHNQGRPTSAILELIADGGPRCKEKWQIANILLYYYETLWAAFPPKLRLPNTTMRSKVRSSSLAWKKISKKKLIHSIPTY